METKEVIETLRTIAVILSPILAMITSYLYTNVINLKMKVAVLETRELDNRTDISDVKIDIKNINEKLEAILEMKVDIKHLNNNINQILEFKEKK